MVWVTVLILILKTPLQGRLWALQGAGTLWWRNGGLQGKQLSTVGVWIHGGRNRRCAGTGGGIASAIAGKRTTGDVGPEAGGKFGFSSIFTVENHLQYKM
ncbi:hypothetical protein F4604DRAFT_1729130 [Suillus subluteus]|nr:hypothetical protein F4604DRAFT_1729130 [Suillus subluteus]